MKLLVLVFLFLQYFFISSFQFNFKQQRHFQHVFPNSRLFLSQPKNEDSQGPQLHILARDMKLTEALEARVQNKVGKVLEKLGKDVLSANVVLRIHRYPVTEHHTTTVKKDSHIAEATIRFKGGQVARSSEHTDDMYASIDLLSHKLAQSIKKHNEKERSKYIREKKRFDKNAETLLEVQETYDEIQEKNEQGIAERDLDSFLLAELDERYRAALLEPQTALKNEVVKKKIFDMTPITIDDAIAALDLMDHPFYVFRNAETNEVNVVYRRRDGGVGHIMPNEK